MPIRKALASTLLAAALVGAGAVLPAHAACGDGGEAIDTACVAREALAAAREAEQPMARMQLATEAARFLPADEAAAVLKQAQAEAEAQEDPGFRSMALMQVAGIMSERGMAEGPALGRALAAGIFENGADDPLLIQTLGRAGAAAEQIRRIASFLAQSGDVEGAEIAIGYQAQEADKVDSMFTVAEALAARGDPAADRILRQAMHRLGSLGDPARADAVKLTAVSALAKSGWVDEALALVDTMAEITPRIVAIGKITELLADEGDVARAREQYARIAGLSANDNALWPLAKAVARDGGMAEARNMMADMQYPMMRDQAIGDLAAIQAGQGDLNRALDIIADLPEGFQRNRALRLVLVALVESGKPDLAEDYAAGLPDPGLRTLVIGPAAAARARAGNPDQALATARAQPTPGARTRTLLAIAGALAEKEKPEQ